MTGHMHPDDEDCDELDELDEFDEFDDGLDLDDGAGIECVECGEPLDSAEREADGLCFCCAALSEV